MLNHNPKGTENKNTIEDWSVDLEQAPISLINDWDIVELGETPEANGGEALLHCRQTSLPLALPPSSLVGCNPASVPVRTVAKHSGLHLRFTFRSALTTHPRKDSPEADLVVGYSASQATRQHGNKEGNDDKDFGIFTC